MAVPEPVRTFLLSLPISYKVQARKRLTGAFLKDTLFSNCQDFKPIVKIYTLYFNFRLRNYKNEVKYLIFFAFLVASFNFFNYLCIVLFQWDIREKSLVSCYLFIIIKKNMEKQNEFLNVKEAAIILGYRPSYLYKLTMWRKLPYYKVGRGVRFKREDLLNYLTADRREAQV